MQALSLSSGAIVYAPEYVRRKTKTNFNEVEIVSRASADKESARSRRAKHMNTMMNAYKMTITLSKLINTIDDIEYKLAENRFRISSHVYDLFSFTCLKQFSKYAIAGNDSMTATYENSVVREINNLEKFIDSGNEVPHFIWGEVGELMALLYELNELDS